jgi:AcrR family transcriptional regulator
MDPIRDVPRLVVTFIAKRRETELRVRAPYRHFRNRDDLLAAVAAQGFRELTQAMCDAAALGLTRLSG